MVVKSLYSSYQSQPSSFCHSIPTPQENFPETGSLSHQSPALRNEVHCHSSTYGMKVFIPLLPYSAFVKFQRQYTDKYSVLRSRSSIQKLLAQLHSTIPRTRFELDLIDSGIGELAVWAL